MTLLVITPCTISDALAFVEQYDARLARRFFRKIAVQDNGCWLWTAGLDKRGYGRFGMGDPWTPRLAHKVAYHLLVGSVPDGLELDHGCRHRACVNPAHLEPVPHRINVLRGDSLPARLARLETCERGHAFTPDNTYLRPDGKGKQCATCNRIRRRRRWLENRA